MAQTKQSPPSLTAIEWLMRFPFLGAEELSLLLGIGENTASRILPELERLGWTEWVVSASPELEPSHLYVLTEAGLAAVAEALGADKEHPSGSYQVGRREILIRLTRLEITAGLNRLFAALAAAATADVEVDLADARSLPRAAGTRSQRWPPEIEAYGCLKWGPWCAPFFVAWDRAGAPPIHRRKRVSSWYCYDQGENPWSRDGMPPILIVCPGEREAEQWAHSVITSAGRRGCSPLTVFITSLTAGLRDPLGEDLASSRRVSRGTALRAPSLDSGGRRSSSHAGPAAARSQDGERIRFRNATARVGLHAKLAQWGGAASRLLPGHQRHAENDDGVDRPPPASLGGRSRRADASATAPRRASRCRARGVGTCGGGRSADGRCKPPT